MSEYVKVGMGQVTGGVLGSVTPTPEGCQKMGMVYDAAKRQCVAKTAASTSTTNWGGVAQTGLQAIASIFGKAPVAPSPGYQAAPTNYMPWIIGGAVVLGGVLLLTRRKKG